MAFIEADGDHVAVLGDNRRLLVFPLDQVPVLGRGTGTMLQKYKDGGLRAVRVFAQATGLVWQDGVRARSMRELAPYLGKRADTGAVVSWLPRQQ